MNGINLENEFERRWNNFMVDYFKFFDQSDQITGTKNNL